MGLRTGLVVFLLAWSGLVQGQVLAPPVELLEGLRSGQIAAEFRGAGDMGVTGVIGRDEGGPREVNISPGTQFWAQSSGRQGQTFLGSTSVDLSGQRYAQVWIPTACTNIGRRAPVESDVMIPSPCPNEDMARLSRSLILARAPQPVIQIAVWAIANDPSWYRVRGYLRGQARVSEEGLTAEGIMDDAARLLIAAGLAPADYRMFR